ncbi:MAG: efflux RND transporter permease subunit, partial [Lewinella sp.]|nr:efflux RND transporter permease subunit [Lewinella sp.]
VVVLLIFWIVCILFESIRQGVVTVLLIPVSFIGIFLTFYWLELPFDQGGYTAFLFVSGLVVNSLIFLIQEYNTVRRQFPGWSPFEVYAQAYANKITPILLTLGSTLLGLLPFLLGGPGEVFWFALAAGASGGLLFSIIVITLISPLVLISGKMGRVDAATTEEDNQVR